MNCKKIDAIADDGSSIFIENYSADIIASDYWDSTWEKAGKLILSFNARCLRILLPDSLLQTVEEMETDKYCVITCNKDGNPYVR